MEDEKALCVHKVYQMSGAAQVTAGKTSFRMDLFRPAARSCRVSYHQQSRSSMAAFTRERNKRYRVCLCNHDALYLSLCRINKANCHSQIHVNRHSLSVIFFFVACLTCDSSVACSRSTKHDGPLVLLHNVHHALRQPKYHSFPFFLFLSHLCHISL